MYVTRSEFHALQREVRELRSALKDLAQHVDSQLGVEVPTLETFASRIDRLEQLIELETVGADNDDDPQLDPLSRLLSDPNVMREATNDAERCTEKDNDGNRCMLPATFCNGVHVYGTCAYERTPEERDRLERIVLGVEADKPLMCGGCGGRWNEDHDENGNCKLPRKAGERRWT